MVTRQAPLAVGGGGDMYILWRRIKPTVWKKY